MSDVGQQTETSTAVKCLDVVRKYSLHSISREDANTAIINILRSDPSVPREDEEPDSAIADYASKPYFAMMDEFDPASEGVRALTQTGQGISGHTRDNGEDEHEHQEDEDDVDERRQLVHREASLQPTSVPRKRADEKLYSWKSRPAPPIIDANLAETLRLKTNYLRDLKAAKTAVLSEMHCPRFPNSLWTDLLADRYIDFGKLLGHSNALKPSAQVLEHIGDIEISTGAMSVPVTDITTMGQWTSAFAIYRKALLFAYSHRTAELESYYDHIVELFNSTQPRDHFRIINYDRSVRLLVGDSNAFAFDSHHEFNKQFISHMLPYGVGSSGGEGSKPYSGGKAAPKRSTPICKNWNWRSCAGCSYRHCCIRCQSFEHPVTQCPETVASSSKEDGRTGGRKPDYGGRQ